MQKKIGLIAVFLLIIAGLALYLHKPANRQGSEGLYRYNHIGDLRFQFNDYEKITVKANSVEGDRKRQAGSAGQAAVGSVSNGAGGKQETSTGGEDSRRGVIEQDYTSRLESLASSYEGKLNSLLSAAWIDLNAAKKADPNADIRPLVNKYYSAGKSLEAECDSQVYSLLDAFESELRANSFPAEAALKARQTYESRKKNRAAQILSIR